MFILEAGHSDLNKVILEKTDFKLSFEEKAREGIIKVLRKRYFVRVRSLKEEIVEKWTSFAKSDEFQKRYFPPLTISNQHQISINSSLANSLTSPLDSNFNITTFKQIV